MVAGTIERHALLQLRGGVVRTVRTRDRWWCCCRRTHRERGHCDSKSSHAIPSLIGAPRLRFGAVYHQACDDFDNINLPAFDVNIDAVAYTTLQFGMTTIDVNDVPGNPDFEEGLP